MNPLDAMETRAAAQKQFYKKLLLERYRLEYDLGLKLAPELENLRNILKDLRVKKRNSKRKDLIFITINPKPGILHTTFLEKVKKDAHRPLFKSGNYCFEQRGKDTLTMGTGLHAHLAMVRETSYKPSQIHQILADSWLKAGLIGHKKHIDVRAYPLSFMSDKLDYMSGKKWDKDKEQSVIINKEWRVKLGLNNIYSRSI